MRWKSVSVSWVWKKKPKKLKHFFPDHVDVGLKYWSGSNCIDHFWRSVTNSQEASKHNELEVTR